ncbi:MAG: class I mannose-6-phosphate isomerase [Candidatus Dormibacteria bacterium]
MTSPAQRPGYDRFPTIAGGGTGECSAGWDAIAAALREARLVVVETYPGVRPADMAALARALGAGTVVDTAAMLLPAERIDALTRDDVSDDPVFGHLTRLRLEDLVDAAARDQLRARVRDAGGRVLVHGVGASTLSGEGVLVYADMPRWEATLRQRAGENPNLGLDNAAERASLQYKRAFFVDWRIADLHKREVWNRVDLFLDTSDSARPKLVTRASVDAALHAAARRPFRVVPYFDPAPWGGRWMQESFDFRRDEANLGWCFDCVPEENSLLLAYGEERVQMPAINLVFREPRALLGEPVFGRFGAEFPIRTDFLDCMDGGNLSIQVHPLTEYIRREFGVPYTQDESYYILDAAEGANVHLGVVDGVVPSEMAAALHESEVHGGFDYARYVNRFPARKHDHFLIPGGTVHGSGRNTMVLEISATPYIFTFKLYDWDRAGLDGRPRPLHVDRGLDNIQWHRDTTYALEHLVNVVRPVAEGQGWREESTGLHAAEFIETRRHWFTSAAPHARRGSVDVLNLVEGSGAVVESPHAAFEPFEVHYAETFIVPAAAGEYTVRPLGTGPHATIKAYVRNAA